MGGPIPLCLGGGRSLRAEHATGFAGKTRFFLHGCGEELAKLAGRWALPRGVQASLRNDEKSVSALRETLSDKGGKVVFSVSENESFEGSYVLSTEEYDDLLAENSAFYIVINDKTSSRYNSEYETVVLKFDEKGAFERNWASLEIR